MAKTLYIYDSGTGTIIDLTSKVYLVDAEYCTEEALELMSMGISDVPVRDHKGYELDNFNMTNLFYGSEA